jgi:hypothetical protein
VDISVKCYSGYLYAEEPRSFVWQESELQIESVEEAWQEPGKRLFKVVAQDRTLFALCYSEATDRWATVELV